MCSRRLKTKMCRSLLIFLCFSWMCQSLRQTTKKSKDRYIKPKKGDPDLSVSKSRNSNYSKAYAFLTYTQKCTPYGLATDVTLPVSDPYQIHQFERSEQYIEIIRLPKKRTALFCGFPFNLYYTGKINVVSWRTTIEKRFKAFCTNHECHKGAHCRDLPISYDCNCTSAKMPKTPFAGQTCVPVKSTSDRCYPKLLPGLTNLLNFPRLVNNIGYFSRENPEGTLWRSLYYTFFKNEDMEGYYLYYKLDQRYITFPLIKATVAEWFNKVLVNMTKQMVLALDRRGFDDMLSVTRRTYYPEGPIKRSVAIFPIFFDQSIRVDMASDKNILANNTHYRFKSYGRTVKFNLTLMAKCDAGFLKMHEMKSLETFVPYQRQFLLCAYDIDILLNGHESCNEDGLSPTTISLERPITMRASYKRTFPQESCHMRISEFRWKTEAAPENVKEGQWESYYSSYDLTFPLGKQFSSGVRDEWTFYANDFFDSSRKLKSRKWLIIVDMYQEGHPDFSHLTNIHSYLLRKLCYVRIAPSTDLRVHIKEPVSIIECNKRHEIEVVNDQLEHFDNDHLSLTWTCVKPAGCQKLNKKTKGVEPFVLENPGCDVKHEFIVKIHFVDDSRDLNRSEDVFRTSQSTPVPAKNIIITSDPDDFLITPKGLMKVEAKLTDPSKETEWKWQVSCLDKEGKSVWTDDKLSTKKHQTIIDADAEDNELVLNLKKLRSACFTFRVIVESTVAGLSSRSYRINRGPSAAGKCTLVPKSGTAGAPMFNVSCTGFVDEDVQIPLLYRLVEEHPEPILDNPVAESKSGKFELVKFYYNNISVYVIDQKHAYIRTSLPKITLAPRKYSEAELEVFYNNITKTLDADDYSAALELMIELSRRIDSSGLWSDKWKLRLLNALSKVEKYDMSNDVQMGMNVIDAVLDSVPGNDSLLYDEVLLKASAECMRVSDRVAEMLNTDEFSEYDKDLLSSHVMHCVSSVMRRMDPVVVADELLEDEHEKHKCIVKRAAKQSLGSAENLGKSIRTLIENYREGENIGKVDDLNYMVQVDTMDELNSAMKEISNDSHTFSFPPEAVKKYNNSKVSMLMFSNRGDSFWTERDNSAGVLDVVLSPAPRMKKHAAYELTNDDLAKLPIFVYLKLRDFKKKVQVMEGHLKKHPRCNCVRRLERTVSVHKLDLPDGEGAVYIRILATFDEPIKMDARQGHKSSYEEINITESFVAAKEREFYKPFINFNNSLNNSFYISIIPADIGSWKAPSYFLFVSVVRCAVWVGDTFENRNCKFVAVNETTSPTLVCLCDHHSWFSASLFLPSNTIVLSQDIALFSTIFDNFYVALLVGLMLLALIIMLIMGARNDHRDKAKRYVLEMEDNFPGDQYPYIIAVFTGERFGAGTSSRVAIRLTGTSGRSRVHILESSKRTLLGFGADDWFLLMAPKPLGSVNKIHLWHNNTGLSPDWYCRKIAIYDVTNDTYYEFIVERWFTYDVRVSIDEARMYEGQIATDTELEKKWYFLVSGWMFSGLRDQHLWASMFTRHPRSLYTRCERTIIAVGLLMTTMLVSMMFFDFTSVGPADLPETEFSWTEIWIGIQSTVIAFVLTLLVVKCFQLSKKQEEKEIKGMQKEQDDRLKRKKERANDENAEKKPSKLAGFLVPHPITYQPIVYGITGDKRQSRSSRMFLIIAWLLSFATILAVSFFVILYGLKFGVKKSLTWMIAFFSGNITDSFLMEPLYMLITAVLVARIFLKSNIDTFTMEVEYKAKPKTPQESLMLLSRLYYKRREPQYVPPKTVYLEKYRSHLTNRRSVNYLFIYALLFIIMFTIVGLFIYAIDVQGQFYSVRQLRFHFDETQNPAAEDAKHIFTKQSMHAFFHRSVIPHLHRLHWYNNKTLPIERNERVPEISKIRYKNAAKGFVQGYTNKLLGVPRLRQLRVTLESTGRPDKLFQPFMGRAIHNYHPLRTDKESYLPEWVTYDGKAGNITQLWKFSPVEMTQTGFTIGLSMITYEGGGYVVPLHWNLGGSRRVLQFLKMNSWADNMTRCIFLEFNVYNNAMKLFTSVRYVVECLPCGFLQLRLQLETASLFFAKKIEAQIILGLMFALTFVLVFYFFFCLMQISIDGFFNYVAKWRGLCDIILIVVGMWTVSQFFKRALHFASYIEYLDEAPRDIYVSLYSPFLTDENAHNILGLFTLLLTVAMMATIYEMAGLDKFRAVFTKAYSLIITMMIFNLLLGFMFTAIYLTVDRYYHESFIFRLTFKEEVLTPRAFPDGTYFVIVTPIAFGLLKMNAACVIFYYRYVSELGERQKGLVVVHGRSNIEAALLTSSSTKRKGDLHRAAIRAKLDRLDKKIL